MLYTQQTMNKRGLMIFVLSFLLMSCRNDAALEKGSISKEGNTQVGSTDLNVSILLDLSDRIDTLKYPDATMEIYRRDQELISAIVESFQIHVRSKKIRFLNDQIALYMEPVPPSREMNDLLTELRVEFNRQSSEKSVLQLDSLYKDNVAEIYSAAMSTGEYIGSDVWTFFKNRASDYCILDGSRNILFVLTDGYMYHPNSKLPMIDGKISYIIPETIREKLKLTGSNWKDVYDSKGFGFLVPEVSLEELEVYVINVNPDNNNPYSYDILKKFWSDWFEAMDIYEYDIREKSLPANEVDIIKSIVLGKNN